MSSCTCGCCAGASESTPAPISNLPGLSELVYRVGTHASFNQTMLVGLSRGAQLQRLTTREDDDPAIALLDAWAAALDVLTFYQERVANEGYLATAVEPRSVRELARAIGYELGPGVAADTQLAFELETAPGAPDSALVKIGTKVQSVPGQDELPQVFETVEEIEARPEWNQLGARLTTPVAPPDAATMYLAGTATNLRIGDRVLLVANDDEWVSHRLTRVVEDPDANVTRVEWKPEVGDSGALVVGPHTEHLRVFALRVRASLFGHNAPDWTAIPDEMKTAYGDSGADWPHITLATVGAGGGTNGNRVFLDAVHPDIVAGSWVVLRAPAVVDALFEVVHATEDQRTDFTMSAKCTRLDFGTSSDVTYRFGGFNSYLRETTVFAKSEELELAEWPVTAPVAGTEIALSQPVTSLPAGRSVIVTGKRVRAELTHWGWWLKLYPDDASHAVPVGPHEIFEVLGTFGTYGGKAGWHVIGEGVRGTLPVGPQGLALLPAADDAPLVVELATTGEPPPDVEQIEALVLAKSLANTYEPASVTIAANVARATHGESRSEILGGGDASVPFQRFKLKDEPLTYVQTAGATGAASSLAVRVNGVLWHEVEALYGRGPRERVYAIRIGDDHTATVEFGDGATGARLPTAADNVRATYRVGTGLAGQVGAGKLTTPMGAPLGVKAIANPLPATGAGDPEEGERARLNAPLTVQTFERIVSLDDVEAFAAAFAGIGKAQATRLWDGEAEIVHVTVALADGSAPSPDSLQLANLRKAMWEKGDPHLLLRIDPYVAWRLAVEAAGFVDPDYVADDVVDGVRTALSEEFSFERRTFGQSVAESEVIAAMQRVEGVIGVDLQWLHRLGDSTLPPAQGARFEGGQIVPAQLLTLAAKDVKVTAS